MFASKTLLVLAMSIAALAAPASIAATEVTLPAAHSNDLLKRQSDNYNLLYHYRSDVLGHSQLQYDANLEANALRTAVEGHGQMIHQLFPGTLAQVLGPGGPFDYDNVLVGGWLCERPDMPGLNGICDNYRGWLHTTTGHADILTSEAYTRVGCAWDGGIWACDLA